MLNRTKKGFTLAELLIVVAIIGVLVGVSIPIFSSSLEKAREATDLANIRSAYAGVMIHAVEDSTTEYSEEVSLKQLKDGWETDGAGETLGRLAPGHVVGEPGTKAAVTWYADGYVEIKFNGDGGSGGSGGSGGGSGGGTVPGPGIHASGEGTVASGVVLQDANGTYVVLNGLTWAMRNAFDNGTIATVDGLIDAYPALNAVKVDPTDVKDSSFDGELKEGDLYYDEVKGYCYVKTNLGKPWPQESWTPLVQ